MERLKIAIASGKGGTGKTTVATNLAYFLSTYKQKIQYLDCDVEEPNGHLFLKPRMEEKMAVKVMVPYVDNKKCTSCGECSTHCQFNALVVLPNNVLIFPELCHSCGLCVKICPEGAILESEREVGYVEHGTTTTGIDFVHGVLNIGEPMAGPIIQQVKGFYKADCIKIIDAPPGTSCPVVKTIIDVDFVIMVTEPTPFGLHDLKIAVSVAKNLNKLIGVVINRDREKEDFKPLMEFLDKNEIPIL
ncbi:MAG TPA: ATP-binding protein, partial [Syntrophorhabdaceae bacterium]|nr:ATP-binding protein [Syntrophorhabdaceae bacterium]